MRTRITINLPMRVVKKGVLRCTASGDSRTSGDFGGDRRAPLRVAQTLLGGFGIWVRPRSFAPVAPQDAYTPAQSRCAFAPGRAAPHRMRQMPALRWGHGFCLALRRLASRPAPKRNPRLQCAKRVLDPIAKASFAQPLLFLCCGARCRSTFLFASGGIRLASAPRRLPENVNSPEREHNRFGQLP